MSVKISGGKLITITVRERQEKCTKGKIYERKIIHTSYLHGIRGYDLKFTILHKNHLNVFNQLQFPSVNSFLVPQKILLEGHLVKSHIVYPTPNQPNKYLLR